MTVFVLDKHQHGKKKGTYVGRVAIRASDNFNIQTSHGLVQGINSKHCCLIQRADGYDYSSYALDKTADYNLQYPQAEEQRFLPALKDRVSALSIG